MYLSLEQAAVLAEVHKAIDIMVSKWACTGVMKAFVLVKASGQISCPVRRAEGDGGPTTTAQTKVSESLCAFLQSPAFAGCSRTGQYSDGLDLLGLSGSSEILEESPDGQWFPIFRRFGSNAHIALE